MAYGHGKVILLGEHSVVYGRPAIAAAIEHGAEVSATPIEAGPTRLTIEPWRVEVDTGDAVNEGSQGRELLQQALKVARAFYDDDLELALHAKMHIPGGAGMGSSAALGVAVLRAMDEARGITRPDEELCARAYEWERVFHGTPGGIDNTMATYGGLVLYTKGQPPTRIVPRNPVHLIIGDSGEPRVAKLTIDSVRRQYEREPERIGKLFDAIASIVSNGKLALETGDTRSLGQLMTLNHKLLASLLLSTDTLEAMIQAAMDAGAAGAKLTGAGGGGCMIALVDDEAAGAAVKQALAKMGKAAYDIVLSPPDHPPSPPKVPASSGEPSA